MPPDRAIPGKPISARMLNALAGTARAANSPFPVGTGGILGTPHGPVHFDGPRSFVAVITSTPDDDAEGDSSGDSADSSDSSYSGSSCPAGYGFSERAPDNCGEWVKPANAVEGNGTDLPLYPLPGGSASMGDYVIARPGDGTWYYFDSVLGGGEPLDLDVVTGICALDVPADSYSGSGGAANG